MNYIAFLFITIEDMLHEYCNHVILFHVCFYLPWGVEINNGLFLLEFKTWLILVDLSTCTSISSFKNRFPTMMQTLIQATLRERFYNVTFPCYQLSWSNIIKRFRINNDRMMDWTLIFSSITVSIFLVQSVNLFDWFWKKNVLLVYLNFNMLINIKQLNCVVEMAGVSLTN